MDYYYNPFHEVFDERIPGKDLDRQRDGYEPKRMIDVFLDYSLKDTPMLGIF